MRGDYSGEPPGTDDAATGLAAAMAVLYESRRSPLERFARRRFHLASDDARDVVGDAFLAVWLRCGDITADKLATGWKMSCTCTRTQRASWARRWPS